jgi:serine/threonine protein kinase
MRTPGGLSPDQMRAWLRDILEVLAYLHERTPPVIHRDVTPRNIILKPDGRAALVDFGSVQAALRAAMRGVLDGRGTFGYAPMEQFVGRAGPASDLYGLG